MSRIYHIREAPIYQAHPFTGGFSSESFSLTHNNGTQYPNDQSSGPPPRPPQAPPPPIAGLPPQCLPPWAAAGRCYSPPPRGLKPGIHSGLKWHQLLLDKTWHRHFASFREFPLKTQFDQFWLELRCDMWSDWSRLASEEDRPSSLGDQ